MIFCYKLLQNIEYSSLCYTVGPFLLPILFYLFFIYLFFHLFLLVGG